MYSIEQHTVFFYKIIPKKQITQLKYVIVFPLVNSDGARERKGRREAHCTVARRKNSGTPAMYTFRAAALAPSTSASVIRPNLMKCCNTCPKYFRPSVRDKAMLNIRHSFV